jgi:hypothetical protein
MGGITNTLLGFKDLMIFSETIKTEFLHPSKELCFVSCQPSSLFSYVFKASPRRRFGILARAESGRHGSYNKIKCGID